eukprot:gene8103-biopygen11441
MYPSCCARAGARGPPAAMPPVELGEAVVEGEAALAQLRQHADQLLLREVRIPRLLTVHLPHAVAVAERDLPAPRRVLVEGDGVRDPDLVHPRVLLADGLATLVDPELQLRPGESSVHGSPL